MEQTRCHIAEGHLRDVIAEMKRGIDTSDSAGGRSLTHWSLRLKAALTMMGLCDKRHDR